MATNDKFSSHFFTKITDEIENKELKCTIETCTKPLVHI